MREFWVSSGHHMTRRRADGGLEVSDELLLAYLARPELKLPAESKRPPKVGKPSPPVDLSKLKPKTF